jgi:hypothetical protein
MLDMTPNELDYLCKHLAHSSQVHKIHYQTTSDVVERTKIGLLLMLKDAGKLESFKGRKIAEIELEGIHILHYLELVFSYVLTHISYHNSLHSIRY